MATGTYVYTPKMDGIVELTASYLAGVNTFTLPYTNVKYDTAVTEAGAVYTGITSGNKLQITGANLSGGPCLVGRSFQAVATLTRPYSRDREGRAKTHEPHFVSALTANYSDSWGFRIQSERDSRYDRYVYLDATSEQDVGFITGWFGGDPAHYTYKVVSLNGDGHNLSPKPFTVTSLTWTMEQTARRR